MTELTPEKVAAEIRRIAKTVGWAIGEHGTKERDLDLIACPWAGEACSPYQLVGEILRETHAIVTGIAIKPHGRIGFVLQGYGHKPIDLSVMTRLTATSCGDSL